MNLDTVKAFAFETGKNTLGIMAVNAVGIPTKIKSLLPNSDITPYAVNGLTYGTAIDGVRLVANGQSKLLSGNYLSFLDDAGFLGIFSGVIDKTNIDKQVLDLVEGVSPLSADMNVNIVEGALISTGLFTASLMDQMTGNNKIFDTIRRPVSETLKLVGVVA